MVTRLLHDPTAPVQLRRDLSLASGSDSLIYDVTAGLARFIHAQRHQDLKPGETSAFGAEDRP